MSTRKRTAILISGRGSNMSALIEAARSPGYPAEVVGVISNRADAPGLETAAADNIATAVISLKDHTDKHDADMAIDAQLRAWNVEIVCLAGFMRILTPEFCKKWEGRAINIHPSLLPDFPGLDTHKRALDACARKHGCTVHFLTAGMDEGPIIAQATVPVRAGDTPDILAQRVLAQEHILYPQALAQLASGAVSIDTARRNH